MIFKEDESTKKSQYCDFCKENKKLSSLTVTRNVRYSADKERYGQEAICDKCLEYMKGVG